MNILFLNQEEPVMGTVTVQDLHHVKIEGASQNLSGFHLVTDDGQAYGKYEAYTTLYRTIEDGYILSDDGSIEHFTLTERDQTSLVGLQGQVAAGEQNIPWHTSDEEEHCKFYSNADMAKITATAMEYVTWHVTYFRDLRIYIRALTEIEEVEKVTYGMTIPEEYQSEPLKTMIAAQNV